MADGRNKRTKNKQNRHKERAQSKTLKRRTILIRLAQSNWWKPRTSADQWPTGLRGICFAVANRFSIDSLSTKPKASAADDEIGANNRWIRRRSIKKWKKKKGPTTTPPVQRPAVERTSASGFSVLLPTVFITFSFTSFRFRFPFRCSVFFSVSRPARDPLRALH